VLGIGQALTQVTASAMQVVAGRRIGMGTVIGIGASGNGIGIIIGSVAGGVLVDLFNLSAPFYAGGLTLCAAILVIVLLLRGVPTSEAELHLTSQATP
jgi:MFS transporter, DHA1 family, multidrug resistance protein